MATIYKMTELYMLQDKSKDHEDTWEFLHRRIEDGVHLQEVLNTSEESTRNVAHAVGSAFETVSILFTLHGQQNSVVNKFLFFFLGKKYFRY